MVFQSRDNKDWFRSDIYVQETHGRSPPEKLVATDLDEYGPHWSPDGRFVLFTVTKEDNDRDLWLIEVDAGTEPRPFLASRFSEAQPYVSPDGRYVVYNSNRTGQWEVFVTTFPDPDREVQVSSAGGGYAQWSGDEIFYIEGETDSLMAVPASTSPELRLGDPVRLFSEAETGLTLWRGSTFDFAAVPGGDRFIAVEDLQPDQDDRIVVVENWVELLDRR
jgi:dipeptidyl aminopeptidase/acylaminoacyl peptidase